MGENLKKMLSYYRPCLGTLFAGLSAISSCWIATAFTSICTGCSLRRREILAFSDFN